MAGCVPLVHSQMESAGYQNLAWYGTRMVAYGTDGLVVQTLPLATLAFNCHHEFMPHPAMLANGRV